MDYINKILCGNDLEILPKLPAESINCCVCSPPYWGLRDYGIEPVIWDGDKNCKHEWGNKSITLKHKSGETNPGKESWFKDKGASDDKGNCFCLKCGAWRGSLGLEPTFELYIKHLCDIFDEVKRVLRKDGTCWVNIGDSYNSHTFGKSKLGGGLQKKLVQKEEAFPRYRKPPKNLGDKSLCLIPQRFAIEMVNRGWILRNTIIWHKLNCMPSSVKDRFTVNFEYVFFFVRNNKTLFWTNKKTLECVDKKPLGTRKGIEGKDWEWRETQNWKEEENAGYEMGATDSHRAASIGGLKLGVKHKKSGKLRKASLWTGHDYWFEQKFEAWTDNNINDTKRAGKYIQYGGKHKGSKDNKGVVIGNPKQGRNKRVVWTIPTKPFPEAHFAVYPEGLIEIPIKAGCPEFICKKCGKARVKIYKYKGGTIGKSWHDHSKDLEEGMHQSIGGLDNQGDKPYQRIDVGYSDCGCGASWESGIVLDPFMGAGTTALVALKQRKRFIGIEIKQEYIDIAKRRIAKVQQRIF